MYHKNLIGAPKFENYLTSYFKSLVHVLFVCWRLGAHDVFKRDKLWGTLRGKKHYYCEILSTFPKIALFLKYNFFTKRLESNRHNILP